MKCPLLALAVSAVLLAARADAQTTGASAPSSSSSQSTADDTRPATTTFFGDTGLWYVPTAEVLAHGKWSVSGYRRGTNFVAGYTNVADFAGTVAVGLGERVEAFGSFLADTRIDRDTVPVFFPDSTQGSFVDRYPRVTQSWTGDHVGDLYVGAKMNLLSEARQAPAALAVRGSVKVPTGNKDAGVSTGKADVGVDLIISKEAARVVEVAGYAGYEYRGTPDGFEMPSSAFRWGGGVGFPSRSPVRIFGELNGYLPSSSTATVTGASLVAAQDQSVAPLTATIERLTRATVGVTYQAANGFFLGGGLNWNLPRQARATAFAPADDRDPFADYWDWQVRIGFHPGAGVFVPPPPPPPPPPVAAAPPPPAAPRAPAVPVAPAPAAPPIARTYTFEDVHFDFDRYSLRPEATRILDEAVTAMMQDTTLRLQIEGHTCNIGTAEYNLALGDRRANAVKSYLVSRGIPADRLSTISYGEERPKYDNSREETRRLNRRAALTVNLRR